MSGARCDVFLMAPYLHVFWSSLCYPIAHWQIVYDSVGHGIVSQLQMFNLPKGGFFFSLVRRKFLGFFDLLWRCCFRALVQRLSEPSENCCFRVLGQRLSEPSESWPFSVRPSIFMSTSSWRTSLFGIRELAKKSSESPKGPMSIVTWWWNSFFEQQSQFFGVKILFDIFKDENQTENLSKFGENQLDHTDTIIVWRRFLQSLANLQKTGFAYSLVGGVDKTSFSLGIWHWLRLFAPSCFFVGVVSAKTTGLLVNISGHTRIGNNEIR